MGHQIICASHIRHYCERSVEGDFVHPDQDVVIPRNSSCCDSDARLELVRETIVARTKSETKYKSASDNGYETQWLLIHLQKKFIKLSPSWNVGA